MFRHPLHSIVRFLMALSLCAAAAAPAFAQVDLTDVIITRTIARTSEGQDDIRAEIRVKGTDISNATITLPSAPNTPLSLGPDGDDFVVSDDFATEAALDQVLPNGNYVLRLNNGNVTVTIPYTRPTVPSPDIDQPEAGAVFPPGSLEVLFTPCGNPCAQLTDSVDALLEDAALNDLATEILSESDGSWTPPDGMGGDLVLGENLEFFVTITHTAVRQNGTIPVNDDDDAFLFTHVFVQSDTVGFRTGFAPPEGDFCLVVNDPTPPAECSPLNDDLLFLLDTSGMFSTTVAGRAVDYDFDVDSKGTITGTAMADLAGDATKETVGTIKGKLKGKGGELKQKLSFPLVNEDPAVLAKLKVSVSDVLSIPFDSRERRQKASGNLGALKVKEDDTTTDPLPFTPLGWRVDFTIAADGAVQDGLLTLDGGRNFVLTGTNKFNLAKNESSLKLQTADKGIKLQLKKVELDDEVLPTEVVGGALSYKILGQSGKATLP